jgi:hypothetical protein
MLSGMKSDSFVRLFAGLLTLVGVALSHWVDARWLWLAAFAGFALVQSAFTGFCGPTWLLGRLGWIDAEGVIRPPRR